MAGLLLASKTGIQQGFPMISGELGTSATTPRETFDLRLFGQVVRSR
jgi:hypothetical protein